MTLLSKQTETQLIDLLITQPHRTTFILEMLGEKFNSGMVINTLLEYSKHDTPVTREGALYGMQNLMSNKEIHARVKEMSINDIRDTIRKIAKELLEDNNDF